MVQARRTTRNNNTNMENDVPEEEGFSVLNPSSSNSTTSTPSTNNNGSKNSASWNMLLEALKTHTSTEISAAVNNGLRLSAYNQRFDEIATVQKSIIEKMTAVEQKLQILSDSIQNGGNGYIRRNNSNESGDEAAIINAYYVEHDHQASVNISSWIRDGLERLKEADNIEWNFEENFTFSDNRTITKHLKKYVLDKIGRETIEERFAGYISHSALHEKIRNKFNRDKTESKRSPVEQSNRKRISKIKARSITKLKRRVRAANNFVHDLSTKYGSDYCTLFGSYMYMSEEETDEEENNLGGSELPTLVSKPPSYRTELANDFFKDVDRYDSERRTTQAKRASNYRRVGEPVEVVLSDELMSGIPSWAKKSTL